MTRTWSLQFADDHGHAGLIELTLPMQDAPAGASCSFRATLTVPDVGVVTVHDDDVPLPRNAKSSAGSLEIRAEGLWAEMLCETPGEHWSFGLEAFGLRFDTAEEAATSDVGDRVAVGYDLEWERAADGETADRVVGDVLVGRATIPLDARGTFTTL
ncbi:MAG: hypothetical protein U0W40_08505 [Acidimicrobiia bacterium]